MKLTPLSAAVFMLFSQTAMAEIAMPASGVVTNIVAESKQTKGIEESKVELLVRDIRQDIVVNKKYDRANLLPIAARKGDSGACNLMGWMFDNGIGVSAKNPTNAIKWFESCAKRSAIASYNAGVLYFEGRGVDKNTDKAVSLFKQAWALGGNGFHDRLPQIPIRLAYHYRKQKMYTEEWEWAQRAASSNAKHGKYLVARMLLAKTAPITDDVMARDYLNSAVESFSAPAASLLAWVYGSGKFVERDFVIARSYDLIASKIDSRYRDKAVTRWTGQLNDEDRTKAEALANNWMTIHRAPPSMDFTLTLNGLEKQFQ